MQKHQNFPLRGLQKHSVPLSYHTTHQRVKTIAFNAHSSEGLFFLNKKSRPERLRFFLILNRPKLPKIQHKTRFFARRRRAENFGYILPQNRPNFSKIKVFSGPLKTNVFSVLDVFDRTKDFFPRPKMCGKAQNKIRAPL